MRPWTFVRFLFRHGELGLSFEAADPLEQCRRVLTGACGPRTVPSGAVSTSTPSMMRGLRVGSPGSSPFPWRDEGRPCWPQAGRLTRGAFPCMIWPLSAAYLAQADRSSVSRRSVLRPIQVAASWESSCISLLFGAASPADRPPKELPAPSGFSAFAPYWALSRLRPWPGRALFCWRARSPIAAAGTSRPESS